LLSILETCRPRSDLLAGMFNPEVFTASLGPVLRYYRGDSQAGISVYNNADFFFREATFPTDGLCQTLRRVFARIQGDMGASSLIRLETAFGGGKTHTLIACTHLAFRGKELKEAVEGILDVDLLPNPGEVAVVGIMGDEIPVRKTKGHAIIPYTLWGEIAYQIGGEALYREIEDDATSFAAPGMPYFDKVFGDRKVLIMLDELAQYAARLEAAQPNQGAAQLAAFLMTLSNYARSRPGIAIVLTLASVQNAFSRQTKMLTQVVSDVLGEAVSEDEAIGIGERGFREVTDVVSRGAFSVTPVQAGELSLVLAKRLFESIDRNAAEATADAYMEMYRKVSSWLPDEAISDAFRDRMIATYPFHPTLIDFLNRKLAGAEQFQGTRGVLRVLALAVRSLWQKKQPVPMIHICHLDMREQEVVDEILSRTQSVDLMFVLNTDVGSTGTKTLEAGRSNAELADQENPHPEGYPYHELTWKTVFLNSLVGREEGLNSRIFGVTEAEALFQVSFPGLSPAQVRAALEKITEKAYYLKFEQGRFFASEDPTINSVLSRIRRSLRVEEVSKFIDDRAAKAVVTSGGIFQIYRDVSRPEDLPDNVGKPVLGLVKPTAGTINVQEMITTCGGHRPRLQQNLIFLLVPESVTVEGLEDGEQVVFELPRYGLEAQTTLQRVEDIARQVLAMNRLLADPQHYGINSRVLNDPELRRRHSEREQSLNHAIVQLYSRVYYSSAADGRIRSKEVRSASVEGGTALVETIRAKLIEDGEMIPAGKVTQTTLQQLKDLFFSSIQDTVMVSKLRENFCCLRRWPVLERPDVLDQIVRAGVENGEWCLFRMSDDGEDLKEFYHQQTGVPFQVRPVDPGYGLVTVPGARQRGWLVDRKSADPVRLSQEITGLVAAKGRVSVSDVTEEIQRKYTDIAKTDVHDIVINLVRERKICAARPGDDSAEPQLIQDVGAQLYTPREDDLLLSTDQAKRLGWGPPDAQKPWQWKGSDVQRLLPLLRRIGSLYSRGGKTYVRSMELFALQVKGGGRLTVRLEDAPPSTMKMLGEWFEVLHGLVESDPDTEAMLELENHDEHCPFVQELKRIKPE